MEQIACSAQKSALTLINFLVNPQGAGRRVVARVRAACVTVAGGEAEGARMAKRTRGPGLGPFLWPRRSPGYALYALSLA